MTRRPLAVLSVVALLSASTALGGKPPINLSGATFFAVGTEKVTVKGAGSAQDGVVATIAFVDGASFTTLDEEGLALSGTYQVVGSKVWLVYDAGSLSDLADSLGAWLTDEAGLTVTVTDLVVGTVGTAKAARSGGFVMKYKTAATFTAWAGGTPYSGRFGERGAGASP